MSTHIKVNDVGGIIIPKSRGRFCKPEYLTNVDYRQ